MWKQSHLSFDFWFTECSHFNFFSCNSLPWVISWTSPCHIQTDLHSEPVTVMTQPPVQPAASFCCTVPLWNLILLVSPAFPSGVNALLFFFFFLTFQNYRQVVLKHFFTALHLWNLTNKWNAPLQWLLCCFECSNSWSGSMLNFF